jgi:hypothetical protein
MTPERWQQIEDLYHAAQERLPPNLVDGCAVIQELACISHQWVRSVVIAWAPRRKADSVKNGTRQVVCRRDWTTTSSCG